jgi:hypothetical protein
MQDWIIGVGVFGIGASSNSVVSVITETTELFDMRQGFSLIMSY